MDDVLTGLNPAQREAAETTNEHCVVLACPGSGKTKTVESKVAHILHSDPKAFVCCTTFSKEGAKEMQQRINNAVPSVIRKNRLVVSTFHSLCFRAIAQYKGTPQMVSAGERSYILQSAAAEVGLDTSDGSDQFSAFSAFVDNSGTYSEEQLALFPDSFFNGLKTYKDALRKIGKCDFSDLLVDTIRLLESRQIQPVPYTHIICDEGQDSDQLMLRWLLAHKSSGALITAMLDDDQTLYSFRNSMGVEFCRELETVLGAKRIINGTNYRSNSEITAISSRFIANNDDRIPKAMESHKGPGGEVKFFHTHDQHATKALLSKLTAQSPSSAFILCRRNADCMDVSMMLSDQGIPHTAPGGASWLERPIVITYIEFLRNLATKAGFGLEMLLGLMSIPKELYHQSECDRFPLQVMHLPMVRAGLSNTADKLSNRLCDLTLRVESWFEAIDEGRQRRAITSFNSWFIASTQHLKDAHLAEAISSIVSDIPGSIDEKLRRLDRMSGPSDDPHGVSIMTAHSSKGLQRDRVIIWNARDEIFPSVPKENDLSNIQAFIEEERRIFYVAMTRAERSCCVIYQSNKIGVRTTKYTPSAFLREIGVDDVGIPLTAKNITSNDEYC